MPPFLTYFCLKVRTQSFQYAIFVGIDILLAVRLSTTAFNHIPFNVGAPGRQFCQFKL